MGQLERYGLYVLVVVIFLILGVAIWGGDPAAPRADLAVLDDASGPAGLRAFDGPPPSSRLGNLFGTDPRGPFSQDPEPAVGGTRPGPAGGGRLVAADPEPEAVDPAPRSAPVQAVPALTLAPSVARKHVVVRGDSFSTLSARYYGTQGKWKLIQDANPGVKSAALQLGSELTIPAIAAEAASGSGAGAVREAALPPGYTIHVVAKGDMMARLAKRFYGNELEWHRIQDANPRVDPTRMPEGTRLRIPPKN